MCNAELLKVLKYQALFIVNPKIVHIFVISN